MYKQKNNKYIALGIILGTIILILGIMGSQINSNMIAKNTYITDICIGGLDKEQATILVKDKVKLNIIKVSYNDKTWYIKPNEIDASYNFDKTIEKAYNLNRSGNIFKDISKTIKANFGERNNLDLVIDCNKDKLKNKLESIKSDIDLKMQNASLIINSGNITVNDGSEGIELDVDSSLKSIISKLGDGITKDNLIVKVIKQSVTKEDLSSVNTILGRYTTTVSSSSSGRTNNIKIAAKKMNGYLMMPGEEFSYVNVTGPYTLSNGYGDAPVIVEGELQSGIGGGVCQLSSTLYNAVLYAGLDIVNVRNHTIASSYVPKGRDATVNDSSIDFIFKNNLAHPVYLKSYVYGNTVVTEVYGNSEDKQNIEIETNIDSIKEVTIKKIDDSELEKGKEEVRENGRQGYTVSTYRIYKDNKGNIINREKIAISYYPSKQKVIAVGTKEVEHKKEDDQVENIEIDDIEDNSNSQNNENNLNNEQQNIQDNIINDGTDEVQ